MNNPVDELLTNDYVSGDEVYTLLNELEALRNHKQDLRHYKQLKEFVKGELEFESSWDHGAMLIQDCCMEEHAEELLTDVYGIDIGAFPYCHINIENVADDLREDYSYVEAPSGHGYYIRP